MFMKNTNTFISMRRYSLYVVLLILPLSSIAQSPFWPKGRIANPQSFGDNLYNFFMSKRLLKATIVRDSLYGLDNTLMADTTDKGKALRSLGEALNHVTNDFDTCSLKLVALQDSYQNLQNKYNQLEGDYNALSQKSLTDVQRLNLSLKQKSNELLQREARIRFLEDALHKQDSLMKALANNIRKALLGFGSDNITVKLENGEVHVSLSEKLLFESGKADVQPQGIEAINTLSNIINNTQGFNVLIEGNTDNVPIIGSHLYKDNWDLSTARSVNIVRYMVNTESVDPKRLTAAGKGEYNSVASNATKEGRAKNRRVDIILIPDLSEIFNLINSIN